MSGGRSLASRNTYYVFEILVYRPGLSRSFARLRELREAGAYARNIHTKCEYMIMHGWVEGRALFSLSAGNSVGSTSGR
jgi:hypothetical protein